MRLLVRLLALLLPPHVRPRWREEWLGELDCIARTRGRLTANRVALGMLTDALAARRAAATDALVGPHPRVFHALDQDLRYALRGLAASPGFVSGVVISLAVGIGATIAAFSVINAAVFRPFPGVREQHELVRVSLSSHPDHRFSSIANAFSDFLALRQGLTTLEELAALRDATFAILADGQVAAVEGGLVSGNYFRVLGAVPAAGRFFLDDEDRTPNTHPVVVISDALWDTLYNRSPSAIGRPLLVNGVQLQIVGVAPPHFIGIRRREDPPRIWIPMAMGELTLRSPSGRPVPVESAGPLWLDYVGRRRDGVSLDRVRAEAATLRERLEAARKNPRATVAVVGVWMNDPSRIADEIALFIAVPMLVLAIACINAANLVFARASRRVRDWTVRLAVGATRWRVVRQVLVEAVVLSTVAAIVGMLLSRWGVSLVTPQMPVPVPVDASVTVFTVAIVIIAALTVSVVPALNVVARASRRIAPISRGGGRPARVRVRFALVALQAALSLGLLATGVQFIRTVQAANANEHVPAPDTLLLAQFNVDPLRLEPEAGEDFYRRLLDRATALPGVAAAGLASNGLIIGTIGRDGLVRVATTETTTEPKPAVAFHVSGDLLGAVGVPLRLGRRFTTDDARPTRAVVVNRTFADSLLNGQAVGRTFRIAPPERAPSDGVEPGTIIVNAGVPSFRGESRAAPTIEVSVVGVVDGIMKPTEREPPILYYPGPLVYQPARTLYLRLDRSGAFTAASLYAAVRAIDGRVPIRDVRTLADIRQRKDREMKAVTNAMGMLGVLALLLAAGGLYGVVAYVVSLRRHEVGIRIALGAGTPAIVGMIVRQALLPTLAGAVVGAAGAAAAGAIIRSRMYGAAPVDPWAFGGAALLMIAVMIVACWLPAHDAGRVDPVIVLREE